MRSALSKTTLVAAVLGLSLVTTPAFAGRGRSPLDLARSQLLRLHGRLTNDALTSPEVEVAREEAARAFAVVYQVKENLLADVRKQEAYGDLRLALWHRQQQLAGLHLAIPVRIATILGSATDSMTLRVQINRIETEALEASEAYVIARDELNGKVAAHQRAVADALDRVRTDPELLAMSQQLQAMQRSAAGRRSAPTR